MEGGRRSAQLTGNPNATYQLSHNVNAMTVQSMEESKTWRVDT